MKLTTSFLLLMSTAVISLTAKPLPVPKLDKPLPQLPNNVHYFGFGHVTSLHDKSSYNEFQKDLKAIQYITFDFGDLRPRNTDPNHKPNDTEANFLPHTPMGIGLTSACMFPLLDLAIPLAKQNPNTTYDLFMDYRAHTQDFEGTGLLDIACQLYEDPNGKAVDNENTFISDQVRLYTTLKKDLLDYGNKYHGWSKFHQVRIVG